MAALFIAVDVDEAVARDPEVVARLVEACPVDIFEAAEDGTLRIVSENLDECTLCDLCLAAAPDGTVHVRKLYE
jgi:NAD-dependent dihydropyrimidine dehydrogenase PreA subunit